MLDFFSLCRGYAAGLACMVASLYFLYKYYNHTGISIRLQFKLMLVAGLMPCFHLSFLNYFLPFCLVVSGITFYKVFSETVGETNFRKCIKSIKGLYPAIIIIVLTLSYTIPVVLLFRKQNQFEFAGARGFLYNTAGSLLSHTFYTVLLPDIWLWLYLTMALVFIVFLIAFFYWRANKKTDFQFWVFLLLLITFFSSWLQFHLLGINYPIDRTAFFFEVLFYLCFIFAFDYASRFGKIFIGPFLIIIVLIAGVTLYSCNFSYALNWQFDADTHIMLKDLEKLEKNNYSRSKPLKLGIVWLFEPAINYYRIHDSLYWLANVTRKGIDPAQDYYFIFGNEGPDNEYNIDTSKAKIIKKYDNNTVLIRNLHPYTGDTVEYISLDFETSGKPLLKVKGSAHSGQYCEKIAENENSDTLVTDYPVAGQNDTLMVYVDAWIKYEHDYNKGTIILAAGDWFQERISNAMIKTNDWERISFETGVQPNTDSHQKIKIWLNNTGHGSFYVDDIQVLITKSGKSKKNGALYKK